MKSFYDFYILLEGQAEDFVIQNPELKIAYDQGIRNLSYLKWLDSVKNQEPVEDIVPALMAFDKNKQRLQQKDISFYKTTAQLRQTLENIGTSKTQQEKTLKSNETTKIGQFGEWIIIMPHTKESSCQWGKGTTWCTAATQSGNLFLNYAGRKKSDIILYYLIKKGADPKVDPDSKISIGFVNGKPIMDGKAGGLTVNAKNNGMNEQKLRTAIGSQYENIMKALETHSNSLSGKHPAKTQMEEIAKSQDPKVLEKHLQGMKKDEIDDFIKVLMEYDLSENIIKYLVETERVSHQIAFNKATETGNFDLMEFIWSKNQNEFDAHGTPAPVSLTPAFRIAGELGNIELMKLLIDKAKNLNIYQADLTLKKNLKSAIESAALMGKLEMINLLVKNGSKDFDEGLNWASKGGQLEAVKLFVKLGAPAQARSLATSIISAAVNGNLNVVRYFIEEIEDKELQKFATQNANALEVINYAAQNNRLEVVKYLLEKGIGDIDEAAAKAATYDHFETFEFLVKKGANNFSYILLKLINNVEGAIGLPAHAVDSRIINFLLDKMDPKMPTHLSRLNSALEAVAARGDIKTAKLLIDKGADPGLWNLKL